MKNIPSLMAGNEFTGSWMAKRAVFKNVETPHPEADTTSTGKKETRETVTTYPDGSAKFSGNFETDIQQLALAINRDDPTTCGRDLKNFFDLHLNTTVDKLWQELKAQGCKTTALIDGKPHFFRGELNQDEIDTNPFFKKFEIALSPTPAYEHWSAMKQQILANTQARFSDLAKDLPKKPPTSVA